MYEEHWDRIIEEITRWKKVNKNRARQKWMKMEYQKM